MTIIPTVSGSHGEKLRDHYLSLAQDVIKLATKMRQLEPQPKDYAPNRYHHARNQHQTYLAQLDLLRIAYLEIIEGIQAQLANKELQ